MLDKNYATSASKKVGSTVSLGGKTFTVVGIVTSTSATGALRGERLHAARHRAEGLRRERQDLQRLRRAASASQIGTRQDGAAAALGSKYTVNTESDLASTVSGSLSDRLPLASTLGTWLSVLLLVAAFLIAILFTVSGVTRRTREFGTLKAIGWSNRRIVGQVAGESLVQGLIGGAIGVVLGVVGIVVVNVLHPRLTASAAAAAAVHAGAPAAGSAAAAASAAAGGAGGFGQAASQAASTASSIVLTLPITPARVRHRRRPRDPRRPASPAPSAAGGPPASVPAAALRSVA